ncbi:nutritionally-regulated adipose and cardiac enriched protein homolog isoform X2 [Hemicordylus capensis]|uniref:nutritionally-regulated adipose and cardiac enriched protein homolog isoform X2 n=1 Tax=Hemicordylus capensis TaxID=884348 RepID=UPI002302C15C|nr:nutritionally-regulated adipose and cardiac enriched protein homolog isoform X2 [Hemicordylus capensis]XP_053143037.1 nutritionally-regulated adipose and cardiac enriched protein homolog isoform X2 [Hemicordylus capensis]XP_053143038.1 nutritionally-regulated adipose and cardiac enriched protein homolog isoform X2 [Hemicordylus capensis]XP_053143039.1 nutritionally-regulated adipose and cardiac enriched protein homolog isoform X2 [Hemicordylus capensis]XP_053143040.1 nutritionally-regulated 
MYKKEKVHYTKSPSSILRKRPVMNQTRSRKQKAERRVRFQEPEETIEPEISYCDYMAAHKRPASILPLFLGIFLCIVLLLAVSLYYSSKRQDFKVLEEFHSQLDIIFLQMRHAALKCWTWFMRQ